MDMHYLKLFEDYRIPQQDVSSFTSDERDLFDDLLLEYIDRYNMIEMPKDDDGHFFDKHINRIQYLVQRYKNIGIEIESNAQISLDDLFNDLKKGFIPRVEKFGYYIYHFNIRRYGVKNEITITIWQNEFRK